MDIQISEDDELTIDNGDLVLLDGVDAIAQHIRIRLRTFRTEWFLDERLGVPWFQEVFANKANVSVFISTVSNEINATPGVTGINKIDLDFQEDIRKIFMTTEVTTTAGVVVLENEEVGP